MTLKLLHIQIHYGRSEKCEQLADREAADDGDAEGNEAEPPARIAAHRAGIECAKHAQPETLDERRLGLTIGTDPEQDNQGASDQHEDCGDDSKPTDDAYGAARQRRVEAVAQPISRGDLPCHGGLEEQAQSDASRIAELDQSDN